MMEEKLCSKVDKERNRGETESVRTALHVVVMSLRTEFSETGQGIEACSLELGQCNFTIFVFVHFVENGIDD